ncbi:rho GTPase-activating protein 44 isoform X9 [Heterocephalus glaber]|uniref:Rho GTPase-activating protein 44 isoform X9 n=1 Tax=Heterocephalus glaber TaxID=10181 RepID=A0AAX6QP28_HETGA|nr:rho GTPase-activating protein 44 isoform X9 [Heterocephalus glaber]
MKKQFNRMRQLANQTVGRAEKTEVLSEDLLQVEKRLELVKQVSHSTHKKLTACLQGQQGAEADKRSDQLSADMYSFVAKEIDYANYFQTLIEVQAEYHRKSLTLLQAVLPQIKAQQEAWVEKPSFGKPLEEHLTISGREIAFPIEACVTMLLECGMQEEGLFRVAPSASKLKKLKAALDCCVVDVQEYSADPHAIAGALKSYLRELPEPLMTFELYDEWIQASNIQEQDKRLQALWNACEKLPKANHNNIRYLIKFLSKLSEYQDVNKMTPSNMAIVLGPNLLWPQAEGNITEMMTTVSLQIVGIIEPIIQHADWFFPGEIEFNITGNYGSPVHVNHNANYSSMPSPDMDPADRRQPEQARRPLSVATDNMMLEFYKKDGLRKIQSMGVRVMDTSWVARRGSSAGRKASCAPPSMQPPAPPAELAAPLPSPLPEQVPDSPAAAVPALSPASGGLQLAAERTSTSKSKELSPGSGQKGSPGSGQGTVCPGTQPGTQPGTSPSQPPSDQSPHTLRKVAKKLAPIPPKVPFGQPGTVTDQSTGQPSPVSLSPTPPSTPSPYGLSYPPGYSLASGQLSPAAAPPLASPSIFTSTLAKSRPTPKPRQRPTLPPPQPPTVSLSASSPQSTEHPMLDGMSPGESMSTDLVHFDIPSIHIELGSTLRLSPLEHARRHSVTDKRDSEEESESTAL